MGQPATPVVVVVVVVVVRRKASKFLQRLQLQRRARNKIARAEVRKFTTAEHFIIQLRQRRACSFANFFSRRPPWVWRPSMAAASASVSASGADSELAGVSEVEFRFLDLLLVYLHSYLFNRGLQTSSFSGDSYSNSLVNSQVECISKVIHFWSELQKLTFVLIIRTCVSDPDLCTKP